MTTLEPVGTGLTIATREVAYRDPFATDAARWVVEELRELEALASTYYGGISGLERKRLSTIDDANPATRILLDKYPAFGGWLATVPSASALDPLYDPTKKALLGGTAIDAGTREWFRNIADAHGIRSRAYVMDQILLTEARERSAGQCWLSLACGAAQPVFQVMAAATAEGAPTPQVTLADLDRSALKLAKGYAVEHGLADATTIVRTNVLDQRGFERVSSRIGPRVPSNWLERFDAVDAVGILEYLKPEDWTYTYRGLISSKKKLAGAITFLRNAFACVKRGGLLIVGNMLDTHPQLGFTLDVVQWPHIQPRSVEAMTDIFERAGLHGHVDVYLPSDGVYAVYAIRKA